MDGGGEMMGQVENQGSASFDSGRRDSEAAPELPPQPEAPMPLFERSAGSWWTRLRRGVAEREEPRDPANDPGHLDRQPVGPELRALGANDIAAVLEQQRRELSKSIDDRLGDAFTRLDQRQAESEQRLKAEANRVLESSIAQTTAALREVGERLCGVIEKTSQEAVKEVARAVEHLERAQQELHGEREHSTQDVERGLQGLTGSREGR
jgi:hypothetical protein